MLVRIVYAEASLGPKLGLYLCNQDWPSAHSCIQRKRCLDSRHESLEEVVGFVLSDSPRDSACTMSAKCLCGDSLKEPHTMHSRTAKCIALPIGKEWTSHEQANTREVIGSSLERFRMLLGGLPPPPLEVLNRHVGV